MRRVPDGVDGVTPVHRLGTIPAMDERIAQYVREAESFKRRLSRQAADLDAARLQWTPPGIVNSIGWLVRHCADEFWFCFGQLSGARVPVNLNASGFPVPAEGFQPATGRPYRWGFLTFDFDRSAPGPGPTGPDHVAYLDRAWHALRGFVVDHHNQWAGKRFYNWNDRECAGWWFLDHFLLDTASHTGQATYLRKLLDTRT